jgi:hypothetical protein
VNLWLISLEQFDIKVIIIESWVIKANLEIKLGIRVSSTHILLIVIMLLPYGEIIGKRIAGLKSSFENSSSSPIEVAKVVLKAIISGKPYLRYLIGDDASN